MHPKWCAVTIDEKTSVPVRADGSGGCCLCALPWFRRLEASSPSMTSRRPTRPATARVSETDGPVVSRQLAVQLRLGFKHTNGPVAEQ